MDLETQNWLAIGIFAAATVGYHTLYHLYYRAYPLQTERGKLERYRKDWVANILQSRNSILAVQTIRNTLMATTWLAGSMLLVLAFLLTQDVRGEDAEALDKLGIVDHGFLSWKLNLLLVLFGFSFLMFLFALRHLVLFNVLIGASPELITQVEGIEAPEYLGQLINRAHARFSFGVRATSFSLPALAWLYSPWAFIVLTIAVWLWIMLIHDSRHVGFMPRTRSG